MGYSFYLISKEKPITKEDYETALQNLSGFNRADGGQCDTELYKHHVRVSGSFSISGQFAEGFVLNLIVNFRKLGYNILVLSSDFGYGSKEDWKWLDENRGKK